MTPFKAEDDRRSTLQGRLIYAAVGLVIVLCGLLWRSPVLGLPPVVAKYGGSVLWGALVYACCRTATPKAGVAIAAILAALLAAIVEFSQLLHWPALDALPRFLVWSAPARPRVFMVGHRVVLGWNCGDGDGRSLHEVLATSRPLN